MNQDSNPAGFWLDSTRLLQGGLLVAALTVFHLLTITPGHNWVACDFALYLQHAKNILEGVGYSQSGYLLNPHKIISPQAYPPVFPLLLAPLYALFGLNFVALKALVVVFFGASLWASFVWAGKYLKAHFLYLMPLLLGLNPALWEHKNSLISDLPFLFFMLAVILLVEWRNRDPERIGGKWWAWAVTGFLIYIAFATRSVGMILVPALIGHDLLRYRRFTLFSVGASLTALVLVLLQGLLIGSQGSGVTGYLAQLNGVGYHNFYNIFLALKNIGRLTLGGPSPWISFPLFAMALVLVLIGMFTQASQGDYFIHLMTVCYLGILFVFPHQPSRYLFTLFPFFFLWLLLGLQVLGGSPGRRWVRPATAVFIVAVFFCYGTKYDLLIEKPGQPGVTDPPALELYDYIKRETKPSDRIMFSNPRVLAFFTGRESSVWHCPQDPAELLAYMNQIKATHLVLPLWKPECVARLLKEKPENFHELMVNQDFKVFRVDYQGRGPGRQP